MKETILLGLIRNIAMLLTFSILYDHFWASRTKPKNLTFNLIAGLILGGVVIILILTPWNYDEGIFFDTRSVLLCVSGLFFGPIPTITAMIVSSAFRIYLGGAGVFMGVAVIFTSGIIGILWQLYRPNWKFKNIKELAMLGLIVHLAMLLCTLLLPQEIRLPTFKHIFFSVIILYPFATILLGKHIIRQNNSRRNKIALADSEKRWQFALEGAGDGIWDWNPVTNEIYFSKQWKSMLGYEDHEVENNLKAWKRLVHSGDEVRLNELIEKFLSGETPLFQVEQRLLCKDGTYKWILARGKVMTRDDDGKAIRCIGTHKDISVSKQRELTLAYERYLLDSLMNFAPERIYFKDLESRFVRVNKATALGMGCHDVSEVVGKTDFDFFDLESATKAYNAEQEIIRTGNSFYGEESSILNNGVKTWGISNKMPLLNPEGVVVGTFGLSIDITERKRTEEALRESEHYTNSILQAIPDLIFILDANGVYLDFKTGNIEDLALPKEKFINKNVCEVLPQSVANLIKTNIDRVLETQLTTSVEYQIETSGTNNDFECFILPFGQNRVIAMVRNISKRKHVEEELKNSQLQLKNFAAHLQNIREEERVSLAREIHDELGQILIALKIDLGIFKQVTFKVVNEVNKEDVSDRFDQIYSLVDKTIKTTRKIMTGLRPEVLDIVGFHEAARLATLEFSERYLIYCNFSSTISEIELDSQHSIALFRILQEALTNIAKHAKATEVDISVDIIENKFVMKISDNGVGLDKNKQIRQDSYGLLGMKERVYLLDGKLTITGRPGKGTTLLVEMPYKVDIDCTEH